MEPVGPLCVLFPPAFRYTVPALVTIPVKFSIAAVPVEVVMYSGLVLPSAIVDEIVSVPEVASMPITPALPVYEPGAVFIVPPVMEQLLAAAAKEMA